MPYLNKRKRAAQALSTRFVPCLWLAPDHTTHTLSGQCVSVVLTFDDDELPVSAIPFVLLKHRLRGRTRTTECIQDNTLAVSGNFQDSLKQRDRF